MVDLDRSGHVGNVRVHCYGCDAVLQVDEDLPAEGLRVARWYNDHGETFCPKCARRRGLPDPWGSQSPWADYDQRYRDTGDSVKAARESVPLGPAIDDPETHAAVTRYGRRAWLWLAAGAALFAATLAFTEISAKRADELLRTGAHTPGLVVSYASGREGGAIRIRYRADGVIREGWVNVSQHELSLLEPGERVDVIYDPSNPSRIRTPQASNEGRLSMRVKLYGFMFAVMMLLGGGVVMTRPRRWRRLLREPWKPYTATYVPGRPRKAGPGVKLASLDDPSGQRAPLRLGATMRQRAAKLAGEPVLWVAGDLASRVVLTIPRTRELYSAQYPRGYLGRKWLEAQRPPSRREKRAALLLFALIAFITGLGAIVQVNHHHWAGALILATNAGVFVWVFARAQARRSKAN